MQKIVIVIGGGASGFLGAITAAQHFPEAKVILLEKSKEVLAKVRISGGGRCNVTNIEPNHKKFSKNYPRGSSLMLNLLKEFDNQSVMDWFQQKNVPLKTEKDGRVFPVSDNSASIVNCLIYTARAYSVEVKTSHGVKFIQKNEATEPFPFTLELLNGEFLHAHAIQYAAGGAPSLTGYTVLQSFDFQVNKPVPSLFTFNVHNSEIVNLAGLSVPNATVKLMGEKTEQSGPLLITHWGFSGPAALKLSAWGARLLAEKNYEFTILINWVADCNHNLAEAEIEQLKKSNPKKNIISNPMFGLPQRLWQWLSEKSEIEKDLLWIDISHKKRNKLIENILNCKFEIKGKSTFKEEFVTCGGVDLSEVDPNTMEAKKVKGLFFSGEILDIDAITGGFNFQAAWTTGYLAGKNILK